MYRIFIVEDDADIAQAVCEQAESWALEARCVSLRFEGSRPFGSRAIAQRPSENFPVLGGSLCL